MRALRRLACLLALASLAAAGCEQAAPPGRGVGAVAPDFEGKDVDGRPVRLSDFKGKVVLLDFWATWCIPCVQLIPHERETASLYKGQPFTILGIDRDHDPQRLKQALAEDKITWPNVFDGEAEISRSWGVDVLPTFILIDHKGVVRGRWRGGQDMAEIDRLIAEFVRIAEQR